MSAIFGPLGASDDPYRYALMREVRGAAGLPKEVLFIMLNPSTATATVDDPTIRRCISYARDWGYHRLRVCNLFALRSTDPEKLYKHADPIGRQNDEYIVASATNAARIVCAWGAHGRYLGRGDAVRRLLAHRPLFALQQNRDGQPSHPLYLKRNLCPFELPRGRLSTPKPPQKEKRSK